MRSATEPKQHVGEASSTVGGDDDQVNPVVKGIGHDRLDGASPADGLYDRRGLAPRGIEQGVERFLGPVFVFLIELRGHHRHQQWVGTGGEDFREDVEQMQMRPKPLCEPAGVADGLF